MALITMINTDEGWLGKIEPRKRLALVFLGNHHGQRIGVVVPISELRRFVVPVLRAIVVKMFET